MIFITVGSQTLPFDRLLKAADQLKNSEEIFAQIGHSHYEPQNYRFERFLNRDKFTSVLDKADILITHGGTGTIVTAIKKRKKIIAVPRLSKYHEHVDDHQLQIVNVFDKMGLICACLDMDLEKALDTVQKTEYLEYQSNTPAIIKDLGAFIDAEI